MIVVDTSIVMKWFDKTEPHYLQAKELLQRHLYNEEEIIVPDLLLYEVSNVLATKTHMIIDRIYENLTLLEQYELSIIPVGFSLVNTMVQMAKQFHVSVYDASYAVLAQKNNCNLITADRKFSRQVNLPFVTVLQ